MLARGGLTLLREDGTAYQSGTAYEQSPLPNALKKLMEGKDRWEGTASGLCEALGELNERCMEIDAKRIWLQLAPILTMLKVREGIACERIKSNGIRRMIIKRNLDSMNNKMQICIVAPADPI